jgi:pimeloyl-ACP methyl ester carboxylesterase
VQPPRTHYARSGEVNIAYQVLGDGLVDLVHVPPFTSNLELQWQDPDQARYFRRLASFSRLIMVDKRGMGLSDRTDRATSNCEGR